MPDLQGVEIPEAGRKIMIGDQLATILSGIDGFPNLMVAQYDDPEYRAHHEGVVLTSRKGQHYVD